MLRRELVVVWVAGGMWHKLQISVRGRRVLRGPASMLLQNS